jgi:magnesium transporter
MIRLLEPVAPGDSDHAAVPVTAVDRLATYVASLPFAWIDVVEPTEDEIAALSSVFGWHALVAEDIRNGNQRQKVEQFPGSVFAVLLRPALVDGVVGFSELHLLQSDRLLVTLHASEPELVQRAAARCGERGDLPQNGAIVATTLVLDAAVDAYEDAIDALEELVQDQESRALEPGGGDPIPDLRRASQTRTAVAQVRRASGQLREVVGVFVRRELVDVAHSSELDLELRDIHDHAVRAHEDLDMLHDRMSALADTRLAVVAFQQNEITKRLSAYAAILIVPAIVTGWFGQNFEHMVGLTWRFGEVYALGVIMALCGGMFLLMRRARWL